MEFCSILRLDSKGRTDVSMFFEVGAKLFFSYDSDKDVFIARRLFGTESTKPQWAKIGEAVTVKKSGFVTIPEWVLEVSPGRVEKMLVSPVYSDALEAVSAVCLKPICSFKLWSDDDDDEETSEPPKRAKEINCPRARSPKELAERMLRTAFGEGFDAMVGREDTPLSVYTDDF